MFSLTTPSEADLLAIQARMQARIVSPSSSDSLLRLSYSPVIRFVRLPPEVEARIKRPYVRAKRIPHLEQRIITALHRRYFNRVEYLKARMRNLKRESFARRNPFFVMGEEQ